MWEQYSPNCLTESVTQADMISWSDMSYIQDLPTYVQPEGREDR